MTPGTSPRTLEEADGSGEGAALLPGLKEALGGCSPRHPLSQPRFPQPYQVGRTVSASPASLFPAGTFGKEAAPAASLKAFWGVCFCKSCGSALKTSLQPLPRDPRRWQSTRGRRGEIALLRPILCRRDKDPRSSRMRTPWVPPLTSPKTLPSSTAQGGGEGSRSRP